MGLEVLGRIGQPTSVGGEFEVEVLGSVRGNRPGDGFGQGGFSDLARAE